MTCMRNVTDDTGQIKLEIPYQYRFVLFDDNLSYPETYTSEHNSSISYITGYVSTHNASNHTILIAGESRIVTCSSENCSCTDDTPVAHSPWDDIDCGCACEPIRF